MKCLKRCLLVILFAITCVCSMAYDFKYGRVYYNIVGDNASVTFEGSSYSSSKEYSGSISIPSSVSYNGKTYAVTSIGSYAFAGCDDLQEVLIPSSVTTIEASAFSWCYGLKSIDLPSSITAIKDNAFFCTGLVTVEIPNSVVTIGEQAFWNNGNLTSVKLGKSVKTIGKSAFRNNFNLLEFSVDDESGSFASEDGVLLNKNKTLLVQCPGGKSGAYNVPNSVLSIGEYSFSDCKKLTRIEVSSSVSLIDATAFRFNSGISEINVNRNNNYFSSIDGVLFSIDKSIINRCPPGKVGRFDIPNTVKEIGEMAFEDCSGITSIGFPQSIQTIGDWAFADCDGFVSIDLPESLYEIGDYAFYDCNGLISLSIPESVQSIGSQAFYMCNGLVSIVIPKSIKTIGSEAFCNCSKLASITVFVENPADIKLSYNVFKYVSTETCSLLVPFGSKELYASANQWKNFVNIQEFDLDVNIDDAVPYTRSSDVENIKVTYTRNFESTNWQALYLPFRMKYEDWADKAEVAYINNVHQFDDNKDGKIERTLLEFITKTSGAIEANKPYVIKPKQTGEVTFTSENTTLYAAPETDGFVDCMSTTTKYTLFGTYQEKTDMYAGGFYGMNGGDFMRPSSASVTLPPFRAYLKIENRSGNGSLQAAPQKIKVMVDGVIDGEATCIEGLVSAESREQGAEFNLNGQKVGRDYKGIVIRNGKKILK